MRSASPPSSSTTRILIRLRILRRIPPANKGLFTSRLVRGAAKLADQELVRLLELVDRRGRDRLRARLLVEPRVDRGVRLADEAAQLGDEAGAAVAEAFALFVCGLGLGR